MHSKIKSQTPFNIVSLAEAKNQLNIIDTGDIDIDDQINDHVNLLISVASSLAQKYTNRLLSKGVIDLLVYGETSFYLPYGDVTEDNNVIVAAVGADAKTFVFEPISQIFTFDEGQVSSFDTMKITYDAGYADDYIPYPVKMGVLMLISTLFENREDTVVGMSVNEIPLGSKQLLDSVKLESF